MNPPPELLLEVRGLRKLFPVKHGLLRRTVGQVHAVDGVDLSLHRGETLALVGESGCGKTTTGRLILRLIEASAGSIHFNDGNQMVDVRAVKGEALKAYRRQTQMVFQDPFASLNPRLTVLDVVGEPLIINRGSKGRELRDRVELLLKRVGLPPEAMLNYPHAFSGGQRQRLGIARALALDPKMIVTDEAVSALDVSIQSQILNLLEDLQAESGLSYIFVAHNLAVIWHVADWVCVMYLGKIVESGPTEALFWEPRHPYTEALLAAVPKLEHGRHTSRATVTGELPDPIHPPSGCYFHTRCSYATEICQTTSPPLAPIAPGDPRLVACHHQAELTLRGIPRDLEVGA